MAINNYNEKFVEPSQDLVGVPVIPDNLNNNSADNSFNIMGIPSSNNDVINNLLYKYYPAKLKHSCVRILEW